MNSRTPDYNVKFLDKKTGESGRIGAAWDNEDGSITLVLNSKVVLKQDKDEVITLFPKD